MGSYRQLTGMQTPPERPDRLQPVPETYKGVNLPYRGVQNHGVALPEGANPDAYYEASGYDLNPDAFETIPADKEPDPVPVRIVMESARERFPFRCGSLVIPTNSNVLELMGRNDRRIKVRMRVPGSSAGSVIFGGDRNLSSVNGYTITTGGEIEIATTENIYVVNANPTQAPTIMYVETFTIGL